MSEQSKIGSAVETVINTLAGCGVSLASQLVIFPILDIHVDITTNLSIVAWFTAVSVIRGYLIRRFFNNKLHALCSSKSKTSV